MSQHKNICIITSSFIGGGAEKIAVNLANCFVNDGHKVSIICFRLIGPYREQILSKVSIIDLNTKAKHSVFKLVKVLNEINPEIVLSVKRDSNIVCGIASFFYNKPRFVFREASILYDLSSNFLIKHIIIFLMKLFYFRAFKIIANSIDTKSNLLRYKITNNNKIVVIGNPVLPDNVVNLSNYKITHPWIEENNYKIILSVGRLHPHKNQEMLILAFAKVTKTIPNSRLLILGSGEMKEKLLKLSKELNLCDKMDIIEFQNNPYPFYKHAHLFTLTSKSEGFGNVLVEAMAFGLPIVCTDCQGGPRDILENGKYGSLIPQNNINKLAEVIEMYLLGLKNYNKESLIRRAQNYSINKIAIKYLEEMC